MLVSIIVAMTPRRVIGSQGRLPWRLPADLQRFRRLTTGHWIVMGRKTYESIGRPLPERTTVVITRQPDFRPRGVLTAAGFEQALQLAAGQDEVFIVGGAEIYSLALPRAKRLYLTLVHADVEGDTYFPEWNDGAWELIGRVDVPADGQHLSAFSFLDYVRRQDPAAGGRKAAVP